MSVCPGIVCEEVLYVCGRILDGRLGEIECGGHGVGWCLLFLRGVFVFLCVRPCHQFYLSEIERFKKVVSRILN